jgi:hypothetical protein
MHIISCGGYVVSVNDWFYKFNERGLKKIGCDKVYVRHSYGGIE